MADMIEGLVRQPIFVPIPIAVVGFGRMGRRHVEALSRSPEFVLSMVVDSDPARVREARALGLRASTRLADACDLARAAVISVPTENHASTFECLSNHGIDCLIEKPLGVSLVQLDRMAAVAARNGTRVFAGYCERFHPALAALRTSLGSAPCHIEIHRTSSESMDRSFSTDVMLDLLVHDLDWLYSIIDEEPVDAVVESSRTPMLQLEEVTCWLRFSGKVQVRLTASRIATMRRRAISVTHANGDLGSFHFDTSTDVAGEDNLTAQVRSLAAALRGLPTRIASLADARRVMSLVERLRDSDRQRLDECRMPCQAAHEL